MIYKAIQQDSIYNAAEKVANSVGDEIHNVSPSVARIVNRLAEEGLW